MQFINANFISRCNISKKNYACVETVKRVYSAQMKNDDYLNMLAARYLDLYQDQISALARDHRASDAFGLWRQWWADAAPTTETSASENGQEHASNGSQADVDATSDSSNGTAPTARPTAASAASDDSSNDLAELHHRINQLEQQLATLAAPPKRGTKRSFQRPKNGDRADR